MQWISHRWCPVWVPFRRATVCSRFSPRYPLFATGSETHSVLFGLNTVTWYSPRALVNWFSRNVSFNFGFDFWSWLPFPVNASGDGSDRNAMRKQGNEENGCWYSWVELSPFIYPRPQRIGLSFNPIEWPKCQTSISSATLRDKKKRG